MNSDGANEAERLEQLIIGLWDAAAKHRQAQTRSTAKALLHSAEMIHDAVKQMNDTGKAPSSSAPEHMMRHDLSVSRLAEVRGRIADEEATATISARVPAFLDDYLRKFHARANEHRQSARRAELTRQQIVAEALALFLAVHPLPDPAEDPLVK